MSATVFKTQKRPTEVGGALLESGLVSRSRLMASGPSSPAARAAPLPALTPARDSSAAATLAQGSGGALGGSPRGGGGGGASGRLPAAERSLGSPSATALAPFAAEIIRTHSVEVDTNRLLLSLIHI